MAKKKINKRKATINVMVVSMIITILSGCMLHHIHGPAMIAHLLGTLTLIGSVIVHVKQCKQTEKREVNKDTKIKKVEFIGGTDVS